MKRITINKFIGLFCMPVLMGLGLGSCSESEIALKPLDESRYEVIGEQYGYFTDETGKQDFSLVEVRSGNSSSINIYLNATKKLDTASEIKLVYDTEVLERYNVSTDNAYEAFPQNAVFVDAGGGMTLLEGEQRSHSLNVSFTVVDGMTEGTTYVIPLKASVISGSLNLTENHQGYLIFVTVQKNLGDCDKGGCKVFTCIESNDTNPLNNLCFTLKSSGKYLFDGVILFSDNIVLDKETGTVHAGHNDNVMYLLNNREKYLKPLQDRGMKVILGIMADHTHASVANLSEETARAFARELKIMCDTYQLDGVFYDDEWDKPENPIPPGFVKKSPEAAARLFYEVKKIMPDRLNIAYVLGNTRDFSSEVCYFMDESGTKRGPEYYVDYAYIDYGHDGVVDQDMSDNYPGLDPTRWGMYSQEFARGYWAFDTELEKIKAQNAVNFVFAYDPFRESFSTPVKGKTQVQQLELMARILFEDEAVYDNKPYRKDW
ncbi:BT_3987 domain-containing protein [Phocaeicola sp.]|uniref:BT_3987 domain-containing protein n=1 Tax=Phocaeicola sp. TaxID=2773926 RepID=UPI003A8E597F